MAMAPDVFTTIDPATTPVASSDTSPNGDEPFFLPNLLLNKNEG